MIMKFLSESGLTYFLNKLKNVFVKTNTENVASKDFSLTIPVFDNDSQVGITTIGSDKIISNNQNDTTILSSKSVYTSNNIGADSAIVAPKFVIGNIDKNTGNILSSDNSSYNFVNNSYGGIAITNPNNNNAHIVFNLDKDAGYIDLFDGHNSPRSLHFNDNRISTNSFYADTIASKNINCNNITILSDGTFTFPNCDIAFNNVNASYKDMTISGYNVTFEANTNIRFKSGVDTYALSISKAVELGLLNKI